MKTFYLLCTAVVLLSSCGIHRTDYISPMPQSPMFSKKHEAYADVALSPTHIDFQGGVSLTKNIGITAGRFYHGEIRNSNELGANFFTRLKGPLYISTTLGWGRTQIGNYYTHPLNNNLKSELHVNYHSAYIHPSLYLVKPFRTGTLRYGASVKYSVNQLTSYYYNEFNTQPDNKITSENIYTAPKQLFFAFSPQLSAEYTTNYNICFGGHLGYVTTSSITAYSQYTNSSAPIQEPKQRNQRNLYYWPLIFDFYVGIRL